MSKDLEVAEMLADAYKQTSQMLANNSQRLRAILADPRAVMVRVDCTCGWMFAVSTLEEAAKVLDAHDCQRYIDIGKDPQALAAVGRAL